MAFLRELNGVMLGLLRGALGTQALRAIVFVFFLCFHCVFAATLRCQIYDVLEPVSLKHLCLRWKKKNRLSWPMTSLGRFLEQMGWSGLPRWSGQLGHWGQCNVQPVYKE